MKLDESWHWKGKEKEALVAGTWRKRLGTPKSKHYALKKMYIYARMTSTSLLLAKKISSVFYYYIT